MAVGLTRKEQLALLGTVGLIILGLAIRQWHSERPSQSIFVEGQGHWQKLTEFKAGEKAPPPAAPSQAQPATASSDPATSPTARSSGIDVNRATLEELDRLPGIGPAKAQAIIQTRQRLGGFREASQLREVPGIGARTLERMMPFIQVGPLPAGSKPTTATLAAKKLTPPAVSAAPLPFSSAAVSSPTLAPKPSSAGKSTRTASTSKQTAQKSSQFVNINTADVQQLQDIKGIGPALAAKIVEDRSQNGPYAQPEDLVRRVKGIGPKNFETMRPQVTVQ